MDIQTQTVAEAVTEKFTEACAFYDLACRGVNFMTRDPCPCRPYTGKLGIEHNTVHIFHLVACIAHGDGARHVRAVAVFDAAEIHGNKIAAFYESISRNTVGHTRIFAGDGNGVKGVALAAVLKQPVCYLGGYIAFTDAGLYYAQNIVERKLGYRLSAAHILLLLGGFGCAQLAEYPLARRERSSEQLFVGKIRSV